MPLEFTLEIDGEESETTQDYQAFIRRLRIRLGVRFSHNRPALVVQEEPPTRFFNVIIRTNNRSVTFRLRMDNLYLIGYQMATGQWLEFNNDSEPETHLINGSEFLGFKCGYGAMVRKADQSLEGTEIGFNSLRKSVDELADTTTQRLRALGLIVVIMMICESTRLIPISQYIAEHNYDFGIPTWMVNLAKSWEDLSGPVLRADAYPEERFVLRETNIVLPNGDLVRTLEDVIRIVGIFLGLCFRTSGPRRLPRMAIDDEGQCFLGLPLLQVFTVCINKIDDEDPGDLYGTITISNGLYTQYIYNRSSDNYESIKPGQYATLTGPSYTLTAFGNVTIELLLTDEDTWDWDDVIMDKEISWDASDIGRVYDQLIAKKLDSDRGSVTVNYAVLRNAVAARVTVSVEEGGEDEVEVYGKVSACYDNWVDPETTFLLFNKTSDDYVEVSRWQNIPLLRSVFAVPMTNSLKVTASLYDHDPISKDDLIANGAVEFPIPEIIPDTSFKSIQGEDGNWVQVTVYWSSGF